MVSTGQNTVGLCSLWWKMGMEDSKRLHRFQSDIITHCRSRYHAFVPKMLSTCAQDMNPSEVCVVDAQERADMQRMAEICAAHLLKVVNWCPNWGTVVKGTIFGYFALGDEFRHGSGPDLGKYVMCLSDPCGWRRLPNLTPFPVLLWSWILSWRRISECAAFISPHGMQTAGLCRGQIRQNTTLDLSPSFWRSFLCVQHRCKSSKRGTIWLGRFTYCTIWSVCLEERITVHWSHHYWLQQICLSDECSEEPLNGTEFLYLVMVCDGSAVVCEVWCGKKASTYVNF